MIVASCIMPTRDRRSFAARAIELFRHQDVRELELLILDDGVDDIADLAAGDTRLKSVLAGELEAESELDVPTFIRRHGATQA